MHICILGFDNLITGTVRQNNFGRKMEETDVFMRFFLCLNSSLAMPLAPGTTAVMLYVTLLPFLPSVSPGDGRSIALHCVTCSHPDEGLYRQAGGFLRPV